MKAIILAGGSGTRLYPTTRIISKHLLPVYDKPMIYYPLSILLLGKIKDILIITTPKDLPRFKELLGDGKNWGINIQYATQKKPNGIAEALIIGKDFIGDDFMTLILGDNLFFGHGLTNLINESIRDLQSTGKAIIWGYTVNNPEQYGVVELDKNGNPVRIIEKPQKPRSKWAVVGIYFYPPDVIHKVGKLTPSERGELEITDVNSLYLKENRLMVKLMGRGYAWLDTGTAENLLSASQFVETIEKRTGLKIACLEEIAYRNGFITREQLATIAKSMRQSAYGEYLLKILKEF